MSATNHASLPTTFNIPGVTDQNDSISPQQPQSGIAISVSAPGKVILHGEHSVVYGKLAVAASLGLRTRFNLIELESDRKPGNSIKIELPTLNLVHSYDLNDIRNLLDKPVPLTKSTSHYNWEKPDLINHEELLQLIEEFVDKTAGSFPLSSHQRLSLCSLFYLFVGIFGATIIPIESFALKIETDLTVSSGNGSSASYSVTVAGAFIQYLRIKALKIDIQDLSKQGYKAAKLWNMDLSRFDERELELISKWAYMTEKIIHGTPSGIDNTICTYGSVVEFRKNSGPKLIPLCRFKLLLVNTKVKRDTKRLVNKVAELRERHPHVVDSILNAIDEISQSAIDCLKHLSQLNSSSQTDESQLEQEMKEGYSKLGELVDMNQHLLQALGVSHPMLDKICIILKSAGLCGKLTGAGGGGYAIALVPPYVSEDEIKQLNKKLILQGFETVLTNLGGPGITID